MVYLTDTSEAELATVRALHLPLSHSFSHKNLKSPCADQAYGYCDLLPPRPPSYDKLQYCPAKEGTATFQDISGPLKVTPQRFLNEAMEYRCGSAPTIAAWCTLFQTNGILLALVLTL